MSKKTSMLNQLSDIRTNLEDAYSLLGNTREAIQDAMSIIDNLEAEIEDIDVKEKEDDE